MVKLQKNVGNIHYLLSSKKATTYFCNFDKWIQVLNTGESFVISYVCVGNCILLLGCNDDSNSQHKTNICTHQIIQQSCIAFMKKICDIIFNNSQYNRHIVKDVQVTAEQWEGL